MKKLRDMSLLQGEHEKITATDFRRSPGEVLEQAAMGKTFTITKNGKPIVTVSQHESLAPLLGAEVRRLGLAGGSY